LAPCHSPKDFHDIDIAQQKTVEVMNELELTDRGFLGFYLICLYFSEEIWISEILFRVLLHSSCSVTPQFTRNSMEAMLLKDHNTS
jgi:hypothetical protein